MSSPSNSAVTGRRDAGFTLIEVLVALAVVTASLAAIAGLVSSTIRNARGLDQRVVMLEMSRALMTRLTDRTKLEPGATSGETAGYAWRLDTQPFATRFADATAKPPWQPLGVVLRLRAPNGQVVRLETVRLTPAEAPAKQ